MAYNNNIPQPGDIKSQSQSDLLANFQQLDTTMAIDHYEFSDGTANNGKHRKTTFPEGSAPTTVAGELAVYTKDDGTRPALFYRQESNGSEVQMSGIDPTIAAAGHTFLPGGALLQWGFVPGGATSGTANFTTAFSAAAYSVTAAFDVNGGGSLVITAVGAASFNWSTSTSAAGFYWQAVGPA